MTGSQRLSIGDQTARLLMSSRVRHSVYLNFVNVVAITGRHRRGKLNLAGVERAYRNANRSGNFAKVFSFA